MRAEPHMPAHLPSLQRLSQGSPHCWARCRYKGPSYSRAPGGSHTPPCRVQGPLLPVGRSCVYVPVCPGMLVPGVCVPSVHVSQVCMYSLCACVLGVHVPQVYVCPRCECALGPPVFLPGAQGGQWLQGQQPVPC